MIKAVSPLSSEGAGALSKDKRIGYISVTLDQEPGRPDRGRGERDHRRRVARPTTPGFEVATGGYLGQAVSKPSTESSEAVGIAAAVDHPAVHLRHRDRDGPADRDRDRRPGHRAEPRSACSATASTCRPSARRWGRCSGSASGSTTRCSSSPATAASWSRATRSTRRRRAPSATAGGAVVFAGGTVVIALCSLAVAQIPIVSALGYSAAIVVLIAVITAITLLPALLADPRHADQRAAGPVPAPARPRSPPARLGAVGARRRQAAVAGDAARRRASCSCWRSRC